MSEIVLIRLAFSFLNRNFVFLLLYILHKPYTHIPVREEVIVVACLHIMSPFQPLATTLRTLARTHWTPPRAAVRPNCNCAGLNLGSQWSPSVLRPPHILVPLIVIENVFIQERDVECPGRESMRRHPLRIGGPGYPDSSCNKQANSFLIVNAKQFQYCTEILMRGNLTITWRSYFRKRYHLLTLDANEWKKYGLCVSNSLYRVPVIGGVYSLLNGTPLYTLLREGL